MCLQYLSILAQKQVTYIPVGIKLFKLLIGELCNQLEASNDTVDEESDDDVGAPHNFSSLP